MLLGRGQGPVHQASWTNTQLTGHVGPKAWGSSLVFIWPEQPEFMARALYHSLKPSPSISLFMAL